MVLYTNAEMTATQSKTVAANNKRSFLRKLIAGPPLAANQLANLPAADQPAQDRPRSVPPGSTPPTDPAPSRARVHSPHSPPANGRAGSRRIHRPNRARLDTDRPERFRASPEIRAAAIPVAARPQ